MTSARALLPALVVLSLAAACESAPTGMSPLQQSVQRERALWSMHGLTRYAYVYQYVYGAPTSDSIRLVVLGYSVVSATNIRTGASLPVGDYRTVDGLFDQAAAAASAGTLFAIAFDSSFGYPRRMDVLGPADGVATILASDLQPLP